MNSSHNGEEGGAGGQKSRSALSSHWRNSSSSEVILPQRLKVRHDKTWSGDCTASPQSQRLELESRIRNGNSRNRPRSDRSRLSWTQDALGRSSPGGCFVGRGMNWCSRQDSPAQRSDHFRRAQDVQKAPSVSAQRSGSRFEGGYYYYYLLFI